MRLMSNKLTRCLDRKRLTLREVKNNQCQLKHRQTDHVQTCNSSVSRGFIIKAGRTL